MLCGFLNLLISELFSKPRTSPPAGAEQHRHKREKPNPVLTFFCYCCLWSPRELAIVNVAHCSYCDPRDLTSRSISIKKWIV